MSIFTINGGMTIYEAETLKNLLLAEMPQAEALTVDLKMVSEIDTTGLQLLLALKRERKITLVNHSHCIVQLADLLHLHQQLGVKNSGEQL